MSVIIGNGKAIQKKNEPEKKPEKKKADAK